MADEYLFNFLLSCAESPDGRKKWLTQKLRIDNIDLTSADFTDKNFRDFDFSDINVTASIFMKGDLVGADFCDAKLSMCDLRKANLSNACMDRADLTSANLQDARLTDACMDGAVLVGARMSGAVMTGADLAGADLTGADLRGASLRFSSLSGAKLEGANVAEADLTGCILDDDAPHAMENFDLAHVDDRKYRMMKSRLARLQQAQEKREQGETGGAEVIARAGGPEIVDYEATIEDLESVEGCYRVLGIEYGTPIAGITQAFRGKAKLFHPDKVRHLPPATQEAAHEQFHLVREAYEVLTRKKAKPLTGILWPEGVTKRNSPYEYSVEEYLALAEANPNNVNVAYNLAWKYFDSGKMDEAIGSYERVLDLDPKDEDAHYNLRVVRLCRAFDLAPDSSAIEAP